ncbi:MAG: DNA-binding protein [Clostridia bacterium]|nr:DNA-binding protein [Clostridia bacterium]
METKTFENIVAVRLDKGDEILTSLLKVAKDEKIAFAAVSGIGATDDFEVGVFDLEKQDYVRARYAGNHEINSLAGNLTTKGGEPYVHLHMTAAGPGGKLAGGHLLRAVISLTAEIFLEKIDGSAGRAFDESLKINRIKFD